MSDAAWTMLAQLTVAVLGGGVVVAVIQSLLYPKRQWDRVEQRRQELETMPSTVRRPPAEDPRVALERSAFAPIEDAVCEGEERALREWNRTPAERDPHEDYLGKR